MVGVRRQSKDVNDLFQVLKETGMRCKVANDVDKEVQKASRKWMNEVTNKNKSAALILVSKDADFVPTLVQARHLNILTVSVSPNSPQQTNALVEVSDIVLEARSESDMDEVLDDQGGLIDAHYRVSALSEKGEKALKRGYVKKLANSFETNSGSE